MGVINCQATERGPHRSINGPHARGETARWPCPVELNKDGFIRQNQRPAAWASAHRGNCMGSADPPGKMNEKSESETCKKEQFSVFMLYFKSNQGGRCRERRYADHIFIQIYSRMHHFVVKFSKFSSPQTARGHWPPNQNPADVPDLGHYVAVVTYLRKPSKVNPPTLSKI